jgi:hypothetical protein
VLGFFFKQIVAVFAIVPFFVLIARRRAPSAREVVLAAVPPLAMAGAIIGLRITSPVVYHYMVEVPGGYAINWPRAAKFLWDCLLDSPLFLLLFGEWLVVDRRSPQSDCRTRWLLAVLAVAIPFSAISRAKVGGWANSLLPGLLAMAAYSALRLPGVVARAERLSASLGSRLIGGGFLATMILMTTFPHFTLANNVVVPVAARDHEYWKAVASVHALAGNVVCPEDPTIPLYAKGYAGGNFFAERDARPERGTWPTAVPAPVMAELGAADFVVDLIENSSHIDDELLAGLGFEPAPAIAPGLEHYTIWQRAPLRYSAKPDRTALTGERAPKRDRLSD